MVNMDRDKQQFVDAYLDNPDRYRHSPYLNDAEVIDAVMSPPERKLELTPLASDMLNHVANYAMLGATEVEIAQFLNITIATLKRWKKELEGFDDSLQAGYDFANAKVEQSLFRRATGWEHPDVHISNYMGDITITDITKCYPGDVKAQIYWLNNRRPDQWQEKKVIDHKIEFMSPEERKAKIVTLQGKLGVNEPVTIDQSPEPTV